MGVELTLEVLEDPEAVARRAAGFFAERARAAVVARARFTAALSGGRTPWRMFNLLGNEDIPWEQVDLFQTDERIAPAGDPDPSSASDAYAATLPDPFDLIHLGLGPDGHAASLVPGDSVLEVMDRSVAVSGPYQGRKRMTLTYATIDRARQVMWLITGSDKRDALARLMARDTSIPGGRIRTTAQFVFVDREAALSL